MQDDQTTPTALAPLRWNRKIVVASSTLMILCVLLLVPALALGRIVPEADLLAFMYDNDLDSNWDIFVMDMRVGVARPIVASEAQDRYPEWSPDGTQLMYHANPESFDPSTMSNPFDLFLTDETGIDPQLLYISAQPGNQQFNEAMPSWSPDGNRVAFHYGGPGSPYRIIISDPTGASYYKPWEFTEEGDMIYATWSADGTRIAYVLSRTGIPQQQVPGQPPQPYVSPSDVLYVLEVGTEIGTWAAEPQALVTESDRILFPSWSPTGDQIVYVTAGRTSGNSVGESIWVVNADGGDRIEIVPTQSNTQNTNPDWLPDGSAILFSSMRDGNNDFNIYQINPDGSDLRRITNMTGNELAPDWRPRP